MKKKYDITTISDDIDMEKYSWLKKNLSDEHYRITNSGFLIDSWYVVFYDDNAEMMYILRWL
jgi:hypothetical protein